MLMVPEMARYFLLYWLGLLPFVRPPSADRYIFSAPLVVVDTWAVLLAEAGSAPSPSTALRLVLATLRAFVRVPAVFAVMRMHGVATFSWILNAKSEWADGVALGADGLMTDYVAGCRTWLQARPCYN